MFADTLSCFSCPLNRDVEDYLKNPKRATNSSRMSSSVTYLVLDPQTYGVLGYFTLMMKAYSVESSQLSSKNRRLVEREADCPKLLEFYTKNGFKSWTRRINEKDGKEKVEFDQMFAVLNDEPPTGGPGS